MNKIIEARQAHSRASHLVANFNHSTEQVANLFDFSSSDYSDELHTLKFEDKVERIGHTVTVSFRPLKGRKDIIRLHSSNWRCEDEPNGMYDIATARKFWRELVNAGFEAF